MTDDPERMISDDMARNSKSTLCVDRAALGHTAIPPELRQSHDALR